MDFSPRDVKRFLVTRIRKEIHDTSLTRAGVLMGLFRKNHEWYFLMTKRSEEVEHHKGQISFPGGAVDSNDKDIIATALREAEEEIGLHSSKVEILGCLDDHATPTGFVITPVVGYVKNLPSLRAQEEEVHEILEVPLSIFFDKDRERIEQREHHGKKVDVYFYDFGEHEIWGATAKISRDFLQELAGLRKTL